MNHITEEVACCNNLLQNVFPQPVLDRLQGKATSLRPGMAGSAFAEKFHDCTFLFAKIVGVNELAELGEKGLVDPSLVVQALQLIFDRFDQLSDTFKVQHAQASNPPGSCSSGLV